MASRYGAGIVMCIFLVLCSAAVPCLATVYQVGDSNGWETGFDYQTWASGKNFKVGDSILFKYPSGHTVDEVSESAYSSCTTTSKSISTDSSGTTTVPLSTAGTRYFICAVPGHCSSGMKLAVTVAGAATTTPSTSATPPPPATTTPTTGGTTAASSAGSTSTRDPYLVAVLIITWVALFKFFVVS